MGLYPVEGTMDWLRDENSKYYVVPNFCINDPYFEKVLLMSNEDRVPKSIRVMFLCLNFLCRLNYMK